MDLLAELVLPVLLAWIAKVSVGHAAVREHGEETGKDHIHAIIQVEDKKLQAVRMELRRKFPCLTGNKAAYSLSEVRDMEKMERYLCKGASAEEEPVFVSRCGIRYSDEWKSERHSEYWRLNFQYRQDKSAGKKRKLSFVDFVEEEAKKRKIVWSDVESLKSLYIELAFGERRGSINRTQIESCVNALIGRLCPDGRACEFVKERIFGTWVGLEAAGFKEAEPFL